MTLKLSFAGFDYVADVDGSYANANSLTAMISATASNSVALTDDYGINPSTSSIYADYSTGTTTGNTETIANLTATITKAEADGLTVMVRPLVDFTVDATAAMLRSTDGTQYVNGDWRAYYVPTSTATFFQSYDTMIVAQARAAQAGGAQLFDIGTELDQLTGPAYLTQWTKIINDVKAVFSGKLTYSAISSNDLSPWQYGGGAPAAGTGDITTQVSFWSQLDYIGIDEYAAVSDAMNGGVNPDPTLVQLIAGWENAPTDPTTRAMTGGLSLIQYYENVSQALGKPLLFTELGYNSAPDAASQPFYTSSTTYDPALQANLYQAFLTAWHDQGNLSLRGVYIWNWEPNPASVGAGSVPNWTPQGNTGSLQVIQAGYSAATACFADGTRIATPAGDIAVGALREGMLVLNAAGEPQPVRWIGHRHVDLRTHPRPAEVRPVRVCAQAFGTGMPHRDLFLSPDHAVFTGGVLIPVRYLVNGRTIRRETRDTVRYFHVELARHDILMAEGLACESFLDTGNRADFDNGGTVARMHPGFALRVWREQACAPLVTDGPALAAARASLLDRAALFGHRITADPDMHLLVGNQALRPAMDGRWRRFILPTPASGLRLVSRSTVPAEIHVAANDHRRLGVAVSGLVLDGTVIPLSDRCLGSGWHDIEDRGDNAGWRWTDGDAGLALSGGRCLDIALAITERYWHDDVDTNPGHSGMRAEPCALTRRR